MKIGTMVTLVKAVQGIGKCLGSGFEHVYAIQNGYAGVIRISDILNADTRRKQIYRGTARRNKLKAQTKKKRSAWFTETGPKLDYVLKGVNAELPPGNIVLFAHQHAKKEGAPEEDAKGSTTLLRLIARHFIPTDGFIDYPANWRIRYIDSVPELFPGTLWDNIIYGVQHWSSEG
eukprot:gene39823-26164_t